MLKTYKKAYDNDIHVLWDMREDKNFKDFDSNGSGMSILPVVTIEPVLLRTLFLILTASDFNKHKVKQSFYTSVSLTKIKRILRYSQLMLLYSEPNA